jgi:hypothetical protein
MKLVLAEDLGSPSSSVLLQRRKLDRNFEPGFHTLLSLSVLTLQKGKSPERVSPEVSGQVVRASIEGKKKSNRKTTNIPIND